LTPETERPRRAATSAAVRSSEDTEGHPQRFERLGAVDVRAVDHPE
jgi:hypothetical protein